MALSPSQVKAGLDDAASRIREQRAVVEKAQQNAQLASDNLALIATDYAELISTVNAYGTSDAFESLSKAELAKLTTEFGSLKTGADTIVAVDLG